MIHIQTLMEWYADSQGQNLTLKTKSNIRERSVFMIKKIKALELCNLSPKETFCIYICTITRTLLIL